MTNEEPADGVAEANRVLAEKIEAVGGLCIPHGLIGHRLVADCYREPVDLVSYLPPRWNGATRSSGNTAATTTAAGTTPVPVARQEVDGRQHQGLQVVLVGLPHREQGHRPEHGVGGANLHEPVMGAILDRRYWIGRRADQLLLP